MNSVALLKPHDTAEIAILHKYPLELKIIGFAPELGIAHRFSNNRIIRDKSLKLCLDGRGGRSTAGCSQKGSDQYGKIAPHFRPNSFSTSASDIFTQVGRPWLHWPLCGVTSISRSSAFISATDRMRPARTEPWQAMVAAT